MPGVNGSRRSLICARAALFTYLAVDWRPVGLLAIFMALNFAAILLAMAGVVDPVTGVLVRNAGSVFVIVHSAFVLRWSVRIGQ